jgi:hypothetical protein
MTPYQNEIKRALTTNEHCKPGILFAQRIVETDHGVLSADNDRGKRAMEFKIKYIEAFNRMEEELRKKTLPPETLSPSQQHALQRIVARRSGESGKFRAAIWSRFDDHFNIARYAQLPASCFEEAKDYLERVPLEQPVPRTLPAVEKPKVRGEDLQSARMTLEYLERWGQDLPEPARMSFLELVKDLKRIVVNDWTALDEALLRIGTGMAMLRRFRGFPE